MQNAYLIHGTSTKDDDWFPWLEEACAPQINLDRISLPNPFAPQAAEWNDAVDQQVPATDGLILVAHSLGCITALRFVARHQIHDVRLLLVGAFDKGLPTYPELDSFMIPVPDYRQITPKVSKATVITAKNDPIAPYRDSINVAHQLGAKLIVQPTGGHFLTSDGFSAFPLALKELQRLSK
ncbi:RBBP9/YdeN family alpha/beta hydrolase [Limosilactobacillus sp.]|uniref:RBBP9/YdeN family alpha/beta hydrolase n=1 Tax=Limosilactobacillus sp. TaxID=2773925 RepID=UPI003F0C3495